MAFFRRYPTVNKSKPGSEPPEQGTEQDELERKRRAIQRRLKNQQVSAGSSFGGLR